MPGFRYSFKLCKTILEFIDVYIQGKCKKMHGMINTKYSGVFVSGEGEGKWDFRQWVALAIYVRLYRIYVLQNNDLN